MGSWAWDNVDSLVSTSPFDEFGQYCQHVTYNILVTLRLVTTLMILRISLTNVSSCLTSLGRCLHHDACCEWVTSINHHGSPSSDLTGKPKTIPKCTPNELTIPSAQNLEVPLGNAFIEIQSQQNIPSIPKKGELRIVQSHHYDTENKQKERTQFLSHGGTQMGAVISSTGFLGGPSDQVPILHGWNSFTHWVSKIRGWILTLSHYPPLTILNSNFYKSYNTITYKTFSSC
jgi:hypothetical protein